MAAEAPAGPWDDTDAAQALALVVGSCPEASQEPEDLATLLQTSRAVRARLQRTSGHARVNLSAGLLAAAPPEPGNPYAPKPPSKKALAAAAKLHAARLAAFAGWLPQHAALVAHLSVDCIDSSSTQPLLDAFKRCAAAAAAAAAPAAQPPKPREGRVTRRAAAAARKLPAPAAVPLQLRSLTLGIRPPAELLSALAGSSSGLTRLALRVASTAPAVPSLAAALAQLRSVRSLALSGSVPDAAPALAQLSSLASLEWRDMAWPQLGPLLAQLPASLGTLLLDLDVMAQADDDPRTQFVMYDNDEPAPAKLEVDVSGLQGLRSLDITAAEWDDDGHAYWHGHLVPTLPPGLTRLAMYGRSEAMRGATSALQELSLTEWWFDTDDLAALISTAASSLRSLCLEEYVSDNHRGYEQKDDPMTAAEGAALTAAIGSATQLTRLVLEVGAAEWFNPPGGGPNSTSAALQPGFAAALANLPSLQVLVTSSALGAAGVMGLTALTRLSVLHLDQHGIEPSTAVALCGALRRLCDLSVRILSSATGSASPLLSAAAQLTGLTRLQLWGGDRLSITAGDLQLLRPLRQLRWCTLGPIRRVPPQAVGAFHASMPHLLRVSPNMGHRYSIRQDKQEQDMVSL